MMRLAFGLLGLVSLGVGTPDAMTMNGPEEPHVEPIDKDMDFQMKLLRTAKPSMAAGEALSSLVKSFEATPVGVGTVADEAFRFGVVWVATAYDDTCAAPPPGACVLGEVPLGPDGAVAEDFDLGSMKLECEGGRPLPCQDTLGVVVNLDPMDVFGLGCSAQFIVFHWECGEEEMEGTCEALPDLRTVGYGGFLASDGLLLKLEPVREGGPAFRLMDAHEEDVARKQALLIRHFRRLAAKDPNLCLPTPESTFNADQGLSDPFDGEMDTDKESLAQFLESSPACSRRDEYYEAIWGMSCPHKRLLRRYLSFHFEEEMSGAAEGEEELEEDNLNACATRLAREAIAPHLKPMEEDESKRRRKRSPTAPRDLHAALHEIQAGLTKAITTNATMAALSHLVAQGPMEPSVSDWSDSEALPAVHTAFGLDELPEPDWATVDGHWEEDSCDMEQLSWLVRGSAAGAECPAALPQFLWKVSGGSVWQGFRSAQSGSFVWRQRAVCHCRTCHRPRGPPKHKRGHKQGRRRGPRGDWHHGPADRHGPMEPWRPNHGSHGQSCGMHSELGVAMEMLKATEIPEMFVEMYSKNKLKLHVKTGLHWDFNVTIRLMQGVEREAVLAMMQSVMPEAPEWVWKSLSAQGGETIHLNLTVVGALGESIGDVAEVEALFQAILAAVDGEGGSVGLSLALPHEAMLWLEAKVGELLVTGFQHLIRMAESRRQSPVADFLHRQLDALGFGPENLLTLAQVGAQLAENQGFRDLIKTFVYTDSLFLNASVGQGEMEMWMVGEGGQAEATVEAVRRVSPAMAEVLVAEGGQLKASMASLIGVMVKVGAEEYVAGSMALLDGAAGSMNASLTMDLLFPKALFDHLDPRDLIDALCILFSYDQSHGGHGQRGKGHHGKGHGGEWPRDPAPREPWRYGASGEGDYDYGSSESYEYDSGDYDSADRSAKNYEYSSEDYESWELTNRGPKGRHGGKSSKGRRGRKSGEGSSKDFDYSSEEYESWELTNRGGKEDLDFDSGEWDSKDWGRRRSGEDWEWKSSSEGDWADGDGWKEDRRPSHRGGHHKGPRDHHRGHRGHKGGHKGGHEGGHKGGHTGGRGGGQDKGDNSIFHQILKVLQESSLPGHLKRLYRADKLQLKATTAGNWNAEMRVKLPGTEAANLIDQLEAAVDSQAWSGIETNSDGEFVLGGAQLLELFMDMGSVRQAEWVLGNLSRALLSSADTHLRLDIEVPHDVAIRQLHRAGMDLDELGRCLKDFLTKAGFSESELAEVEAKLGMASGVGEMLRHGLAAELLALHVDTAAAAQLQLSVPSLDPMALKERLGEAAKGWTVSPDGAALLAPDLDAVFQTIRALQDGPAMEAFLEALGTSAADALGRIEVHLTLPNAAQDAEDFVEVLWEVLGCQLDEFLGQGGGGGGRQDDGWDAHATDRHHLLGNFEKLGLHGHQLQGLLPMLQRLNGTHLSGVLQNLTKRGKLSLSTAPSAGAFPAEMVVDSGVVEKLSGMLEAAGLAGAAELETREAGEGRAAVNLSSVLGLAEKWEGEGDGARAEKVLEEGLLKLGGGPEDGRVTLAVPQDAPSEAAQTALVTMEEVKEEIRALRPTLMSALRQDEAKYADVMEGVMGWVEGARVEGSETLIDPARLTMGDIVRRMIAQTTKPNPTLQLTDLLRLRRAITPKITELTEKYLAG